MVLFILLSPLKFSPVIGWMYTYSTVVTKIKYVNVSLECILKSLFDTITCASLLSNMIIVRLRSANLPRAIHVVCLLYLRLPGLRVDSVTSQSFYLHSRGGYGASDLPRVERQWVQQPAATLIHNASVTAGHYWHEAAGSGSTVKPGWSKPHTHSTSN